MTSCDGARVIQWQQIPRRAGGVNPPRIDAARENPTKRILGGLTAPARLSLALRFPLSTLHHLHRDERGAISVLTVFVVFMFTIIMAMIVNVGRHIDDKLRM